MTLRHLSVGALFVVLALGCAACASFPADQLHRETGSSLADAGADDSAGPGPQPTYLVDANHPSASDTNPGTASQPLKTIQEAVRRVKAGEIIEVRQGDYQGPVFFTFSGSPGHPIVLRAAAGERPVIHGTADDRPIELGAEQGENVAIGWITVEGFELRDGREGIKFYSGDHLVFRNNLIHHNLRHGVLGSGGRDVVFDSNQVHDNGFGDQSGWTYGMMAHGHRYQIINNLFWKNAAAGLNVVGEPFASVKHPDPDFASATDWLVANNVFAFQSHGVGVAVEGPEVSSLRIHNNIFYQNAELESGTQGVSFCCNAQGGHQITHNLFYDPAGGAPFDSSSLFSESNNLLQQDPQLVGAGSFDFRLTPGSPARDQGLTLSQVAVDLLGVKRPQGAAYDIGAYELSSSR